MPVIIEIISFFLQPISMRGSYKPEKEVAPRKNNNDH